MLAVHAHGGGGRCPTDRPAGAGCWHLARKGQQAAFAAARPGAECQAIDAAARKVIADAACGPGYRYLTHWLGHGIGMDGHEWPYMVRGDVVLTLPNPHRADISVDLLQRILRRSGVSRTEWLAAGK